MKKWAVGIVVLLTLSVIFLYVLIPRAINISHSTIINCTFNGAVRNIASKDNWHKWWPASHTETTDTFSYNKFSYHLGRTYIDNIEVLIKGSDTSINSRITVIPAALDSVYLKWQCSLNTSSNPIVKIRDYLAARQLEENMEEILAELKSFLDKKENIYGINIQRAKVQDTVLMAKKVVFSAYPATKDVYGLIQDVKNYIQQQGGKETGYPMLNVQQVDSTHIETMVAIPINRELHNSNNFSFKRMVPGKILVAEVKGGEQRVREAVASLQNYVDDYKLKSPAIPFESLVTDRTKETDTSKWITKLYYPIL
jgi:effector-binding domain-containing protein